MGGGNLANHNKKKGFAISGILYPILILTLFLVVQVLFMLQTRKNILDKARTELADSVNRANQVYTNEELSTLIQDQQEKNQILTNTITTLQNKITTLEDTKLNKSYRANGLTVRKEPFGKYFNSDPNPYVIIKLGNLKLSTPSMVLITLNAYQYGKYNSMIIGGYMYSAENYVLTPSISYTQRTSKLNVWFGVKNDDMHLIIDKGAYGYLGFYVTEIAVMHSGGGTAIVDSGWSITGSANMNNFDKTYKCIEQ